MIATKKIFFISNIAKGIGSFSVASIEAAKKCGFEFHIAANFANALPEQLVNDEKKYGIKIHHIDFVRNPLNIKNVQAYKQICELIRKEQFDIIHCNTPIGGVIGRLAGKKCRVKLIIYEAHGFHFWKGAPLKNWLVYYPVERILAHYTNAIITINKEDLNYARKMHLKPGGKIFYVHGVGTEIDRFSKIDTDREHIRTQLGLTAQDIMLLAVGDFTPDKNHMFVMRTLKHLPQNYKFYICGDGVLREKYENYIQSNELSDRVIFLGYRTDIPDILNASDLFVMPSKMEGLPRALMEAMAAKIPIVCSRNKGHLELIKDAECLFKYSSESEFLKCVPYALKNRDKLVEENYQNLQNFRLSNVVEELKNVYQEMGEYL